MPPFSPALGVVMGDDLASMERENRLRTFGALALVAIGIGGILWIGARAMGFIAPGEGSYTKGASVGQVQVIDERGAKHRLSEYQGQVLVVDVWATWCPPCRQSLPEVAALQRASDGRYQVLAISVDREGWGAVQPFLQENAGLGLKAVLPAGPEALEPFGEISGIPTTILVDRKGHLVKRWSGYYPGRAEEELKRLL